MRAPSKSFRRRSASGAKFGAIAHAAASVGTLEVKARYPESGAISPPGALPPPGTKPASPGTSSVSAQPPLTRPAEPILPAEPPAWASGHTAQR